MNLKHVISTKQFLDIATLESIFKSAKKFEKMDAAHSLDEPLKGKILASLFYEPSTRTRFSFEVAMHKLGGSVVSTENAAQFSSASKGETLADSIKIVSGYVDGIVLRHNEQGSAKIASEVSSVPVINAGDGAGEHPTQALLDIYTITQEGHTIDDLSIALVGDLLNGRTIHSLLPLLSLYQDVTIYLVSPPSLRLPEQNKNDLDAKKITYKETESLAEIIDKVDVVYMTRIQKERFSSIDDYNEVKDAFILDMSLVKRMKEKATIMHPLPRVNEIAPEVDQDQRAAYFRQAKNGMYVRMALLNELLG